MREELSETHQYVIQYQHGVTWFDLMHFTEMEAAQKWGPRAAVPMVDNTNIPCPRRIVKRTIIEESVFLPENPMS